MLSLIPKWGLFPRLLLPVKIPDRLGRAAESVLQQLLRPICGPRGVVSEGSVWAVLGRRKWFADNVLRIVGPVFGPKWEILRDVFGRKAFSANDLSTPDPLRNTIFKTGRLNRFVGFKSLSDGHLQRGKGLWKELAAASYCLAGAYGQTFGSFLGQVRPVGGKNERRVRGASWPPLVRYAR